MKRLFVAVVPDGIQENHELKRLLLKLKRTVVDRNQEARWTPPDLWHVTLQFLGDVDVEKACHAFSSVELSQDDVMLRVQGVGAFPEELAARALWLGIHKNQSLLDLQAELTTRLSGHGLPVDEREFQPHMTLARFRNSISVSDLVGLGGRKHFGDYGTRELILFESALQGNMTKYIPLMRRPLGRS